MSVTRSQLFHVSAPHEVGQLHKVLKVVSDTGADIVGYAGWAEGEKGHLLIVADDPTAASAALQAGGYDVSTRDVVVVRESNTVGKGAGLAEKIAAAGINLTMAFATATGDEYVTVYQNVDAAALAAALE